MANIPRNTPFTVEVQADPAGDPAVTAELTVTGFATPFLQPYAGGIARFPFPTGLSAGAYQLSAVSIGADGLRSTPIVDVLIVQAAAPNAPLRITVVLNPAP